MEANTPWVAQEDGTHLPSQELIEKVRSNPDQYPNAVEDFSVISGLPEERVQEILFERNAVAETVRNLTYLPGTRMMLDAVEGLGRSVEWGTRKLFGDDAGDTVKGVVDSIDPAFETEKSTFESINEVGGQALPAIGASVATGGVLPGIVAGAGVAHLTFGDEDNLVSLVDDLSGGKLPDFLVVQPEDDADTSAIKSIGANLVTDLALGGAAPAIAKVYRVFKGKPTREALEEIAEETGVTLREAEAPIEPRPVETPSVPEAAPSTQKAAQSATEDLAARVEANLPTPKETRQVTQETVKRRVIDDILARETGQTAPDVIEVPREFAQSFRQDVLGGVQRTINRSKETNTGLSRSLEDFESGAGFSAYSEHAEKALKAIHLGNTEEVVRLARSIDKLPAAATLGGVYRTGLIRKALEINSAKFDEIIQYIRANPEKTTGAALNEVTEEYFKGRQQLWELYRESGSAASYAFHLRQGRKFEDEFAERMLKFSDEQEDKFMKELKEHGYNLFSDRSEFLAANIIRFREMGLNPAPLLDDLSRMFDEFDQLRQGALANIDSNKLNKLTDAQRLALENSWARWVNDMRASAMLGQVSTAALEATSNFAQVALAPITRAAASGNLARAYREYVGYATAVGRTWDIFKKAVVRSKSVIDDFDTMDGNHVLSKDYTKLAEDGAWFRYIMYRLWDGASGLSIGASESMKAMRAVGLAYADGFEFAIKQGATRPQAKQLAQEYVSKVFDADGRLLDQSIMLDVQQNSWQAAFDTRYATGQLAQAVNNWRNSPQPIVSALANFAVPFWRTLINIGSNSAQMVMPIPPVVLKQLSKTQWGSKLVGTVGPEGTKTGLLRFVDDFNGVNGEMARQSAIGRQRLGHMTMAAAWAGMEAGLFDITGPSGFKRWDAKAEEMQTYPGSSLIINGKAVDLTRMLPFSAPFMLLGVMKDMKREQMLEMRDGNYVADEDKASEVFTRYGTALGLLSYTLLSDAAAFRGVGDFWGSITKAAEEGDVRSLTRLMKDYGKSFTPGLVRMAGKNQGIVTGDWTQHQAEGFLNEVLAASGWKTGYTRLDWRGRPIEDAGRGIDPTNTKPIHTEEDLDKEYILLNKTADLSLRLDRPDRVFKPSDWKAMGYQPSLVDSLFGDTAPSLTQMKTTDGANAWDRYRKLIYDGKASADTVVNAGTTGSRIPIGSVTIKKGENFQDSLKRIIQTNGYLSLTPEARAQVFRAVHGYFKKEAKGHLADNVIVDPALFKNSRYGSPIETPTTLKETAKAAKKLAAEVHTTRGSPLDEAFAIK